MARTLEILDLSSNGLVDGDLEGLSRVSKCGYLRLNNNNALTSEVCKSIRGIVSLRILELPGTLVGDAAVGGVVSPRRAGDFEASEHAYRRRAEGLGGPRQTERLGSGEHPGRGQGNGGHRKVAEYQETESLKDSYHGSRVEESRRAQKS